MHKIKTDCQLKHCQTQLDDGRRQTDAGHGGQSRLAEVQQQRNKAARTLIGKGRKAVNVELEVKHEVNRFFGHVDEVC